jgi:GNAT superfamily N-acetyltransferase
MTAGERLDPVVSLTDAPTAEEQHAIDAGLAHFNEEQSGIRDTRPLAVVVRDPRTNQPVGGLTGRTSLGLLFIDLFFLPDELRGGGLGARLMRLAEDEARRPGCVAAVLYTISFQAPGFYEKNGYRVLGTIACLPPGTSRIFMTKPLA